MISSDELISPRCRLPSHEVRTSGGVFWACNVCGGRAVTIELLRNRFTPESHQFRLIGCAFRRSGSWHRVVVALAKKTA